MASEGHKNWVLSITQPQDESRLVSAFQNKTVGIWIQPPIGAKQHSKSARLIPDLVKSTSIIFTPSITFVDRRQSGQPPTVVECECHRGRRVGTIITAKQLISDRYRPRYI
jgi:hypothetical protein